MIPNTFSKVLIRITTVLKERNLDTFARTQRAGDTCGFVKKHKNENKEALESFKA